MTSGLSRYELELHNCIAELAPLKETRYELVPSRIHFVFGHIEKETKYEIIFCL
jgi:hypothetical protein